MNENHVMHKLTYFQNDQLMTITLDQDLTDVTMCLRNDSKNL